MKLNFYERSYHFAATFPPVLEVSYTLFFLNKNVVSTTLDEYSYFSADFRLKIFLYYS